jgi:hypothetical protein
VLSINRTISYQLIELSNETVKYIYLKLHKNKIIKHKRILLLSFRNKSLLSLPCKQQQQQQNTQKPKIFPDKIKVKEFSTKEPGEKNTEGYY